MSPPTEAGMPAVGASFPFDPGDESTKMQTVDGVFPADAHCVHDSHAHQRNLPTLGTSDPAQV